MYEQQTYEQILQRLIDGVPSDVQKSEGSFVYDVLAPAALELAQAYVQLDQVLNLGFAPTTSGPYLDYRGAEHGLQRKPALPAGGTVVISGTEGTQIPAGSLFATSGGLDFRTTAQVSIGASGEAAAAVSAAQAGSAGNIPGGAITQIPVAIPGVTAVTNPLPTTGGADQEKDSDLLNRLLDKVRAPATSGNAAHYQQWALEVPGVGEARVFPTWNGPGTVKLAVVDADKQPAPAPTVQAVADHIEAVRPIGASVTVASAEGISIDVGATIALLPGADLSQVQDAFQTALENYLQRIAFQQPYVSYAQVGTLIMEIPGVADYTGLSLNGGTANIPVGLTQVAVKGTVSLHE